MSPSRESEWLRQQEGDLHGAADDSCSGDAQGSEPPVRRRSPPRSAGGEAAAARRRLGQRAPAALLAVAALLATGLLAWLRPVRRGPPAGRGGRRIVGLSGGRDSAHAEPSEDKQNGNWEPTDWEEFTLLYDSSGKSAALLCRAAGFLTAYEDGSLALSASLGPAGIFELVGYGNATLSLRSAHGKYVAAPEGRLPSADSTGINESEKFETIMNTDGTISLLSFTGVHVSFLRTLSGHLGVTADEDTSAASQRFRMIDNPDGSFALEYDDHMYLSVNEAGHVTARRSTIGKAESFSIIMNADDGSLSLQSSKAGYVSVLSDGRVHATSHEIRDRERFTMVTDQIGELRVKSSFLGTYLSVSSKTAAELFSRSTKRPAIWEKFVVLTNPDGTTALRCSEGLYLAAHKNGSMSASTAIGDSETFRMLTHHDGTVSFRTAHDTYLTADRGAPLAASGTSTGELERFKVIPNADGTSTLETRHGRYVTVEGLRVRRSNFSVYSAKRTDGALQAFWLVNVASDVVALKSLHGTYLTVDDFGSLIAGPETIGKSESFQVFVSSSSTVFFKTMSGGFISAMPHGAVLALGKGRGKWEAFTLVSHHDGTVSIRSYFGTYLTVSSLPVYTFYMYRAMTNESYPMQNVNAGNLPGVMWYLHNEVVVSKPRKFGISRIHRFKVQMTSTPSLSKRGMTFGPRFAYDSKKCTGPGTCEDFYRKHGYHLGCNYLGDFPFPMAVKGYWSGYPGAIWYSLPKEGYCHHTPAGEKGCTYTYTPAGSINISAIYSDGDCQVEENEWVREYDLVQDAGVGCSFWNKKFDIPKNEERVRAAQRAFDLAYPEEPSNVSQPNPVCDFNCYRYYSGQDMVKNGRWCKCSAFPIAQQYRPPTNWDAECRPNRWWGGDPHGLASVADLLA